MARGTKGTDLLTGAVIQARDLLVQRAEEMTKVYKPGQFMTRKVDSRTMDKYLMNISPEEMAQVAMADPGKAEQWAGRINTLEGRLASRTPMPAQDAYEPDLEG